MVAILSSVQPAAEPVVPGELRYARRLNSGVRRHKFAGALPCQRLAPVNAARSAAFSRCISTIFRLALLLILSSVMCRRTRRSTGRAAIKPRRSGYLRR